MAGVRMGSTWPDGLLSWTIWEHGKKSDFPGCPEPKPFHESEICVQQIDFLETGSLEIRFFKQGFLDARTGKIGIAEICPEKTGEVKI